MFTRWNPVSERLEKKDPVAVALGKLRWHGVRYQDRRLHAAAMAAKRWQGLDAVARRKALAPAHQASKARAKAQAEEERRQRLAVGQQPLSRLTVPRDYDGIE